MTLYTASSAIRGMKAEGMAILDAKRQKYHLRSGGSYLHWSGGFLTDTIKHAWSGTIEQARACRLTFDAAAGCRAIRVDLAPLPTTEEAI